MFLDQIEKRLNQAQTPSIPHDAIRRSKMALSVTGADDTAITCGLRLPSRVHARLKELLAAGHYPSLRAAALDMLLTGLAYHETRDVG